jgi:hypothetical protein
MFYTIHITCTYFYFEARQSCDMDYLFPSNHNNAIQVENELPKHAISIYPRTRTHVPLGADLQE